MHGVAHHQMQGLAHHQMPGVAHHLTHGVVHMQLPEEAISSPEDLHLGDHMADLGCLQVVALPHVLDYQHSEEALLLLEVHLLLQFKEEADPHQDLIKQ